MHTLSVRNVNEALAAGIELLRLRGVERDSRNGPVIMADNPVTTIYARPWERVLFCPKRDANPFFHLVESLWMLAGRKDVKTVATYVKRMATYSDDRVTLNGAYGWRWRQHFVQDQLAWAIRRLAADPNDRRVVIGMWDPDVDMAGAASSKDVPCNTQIYVWITVDGKLSITVTCRSNDLIWGAHGANAVHFSYLQEYIACALGIPMGAMYQVSNNYHAYLKTLEPLADYPTPNAVSDPYVTQEFEPTMPLHSGNTQEFDEDVAMLLDENVTFGLRSPWLRKVAVPVMKAHQAYRDKANGERFENAQACVAQIRAHDWRLACSEWLSRRQAEHLRAADDGVSHEQA